MSETATTEAATTPTEASTSSEAAAATLLSSTETVATTETAGTTTETAKPSEEAKPAVEAAKPEGAPETYEFTAPEGKTYDAAVLESFSNAAKAANLTQDAAQKLLTNMAPALAERQAEQIKAVQTEWVTAVKADKEFGGEKLQENLAVAKKALDHFAPKSADGSVNPFRKLLDDSGFGNNPEFIRFVYRVGKGMSEDTFVSGGAKTEPADRAKRLYNNTK